MHLQYFRVTPDHRQWSGRANVVDACTTRVTQKLTSCSLKDALLQDHKQHNSPCAHNSHYSMRILWSTSRLSMPGALPPSPS
jgi:hypothetical protein